MRRLQIALSASEAQNKPHKRVAFATLLVGSDEKDVNE